MTRHNKKIRFGILGTAHITPKAIIVPLQNSIIASLSGIAARDKDRALSFAQMYNIPNVYDDYQSLIDSDNIDAVYIPLANHLHCEWIIKCADAGKHILVEKPLCLSSTQFLEIENHVNKNKVHLLEGLMVQHHPWQKKVFEILKSGMYGKIIATTTVICFESKYSTDNYRLYPSFGGGIFWDVGSYWVQFLQKCISAPILTVRGFSRFDGPNRIDQDFEAKIDFTENIQSTFSASFHQPFTARHTVVLDKAMITIGNFLRPAIRKSALTITITDNNNKRESITFKPECFYESQLSFFHDVLTGENENISLETMCERISIMEKIYGSAKLACKGVLRC
jgi:dTDP-3,4-didehydro-2,6-dideoxy-alpha-D-glucose 3-reductase